MCTGLQKFHISADFRCRIHRQGRFPCRVLACALDAANGNPRQLLFRNVFANAFAQRFLRTDDIQQVVHHLERHAEVLPILAAIFHLILRRARQQQARLHGGSQQIRRFVQVDVAYLVRRRLRALAGYVHRLPSDHARYARVTRNRFHRQHARAVPCFRQLRSLTRHQLHCRRQQPVARHGQR